MKGIPLGRTGRQSDVVTVILRKISFPFFFGRLFIWTSSTEFLWWYAKGIFQNLCSQIGKMNNILYKKIPSS